MINLPQGLVTRPATLQDVDAITALVVAAERAVDGASEMDREDIALWTVSDPSFDPALDTLLVRDDRALAAAAMYWRGKTEAYVHPSRTGRGIGGALVSWSEGRARERGSRTIGQTVIDRNRPAIELLERHGYAPRFASWILEADLGEPPPQVALPPGIALRRFEPGRDDREVFALIDAAFSEWPEREDPWSFEDWSLLVTGHGAFSAETSWLAVDGQEIVGAVMSFDYPGEDGWVQQLATKDTHRHRGIARALLLQCFATFRSPGKRTCGLNTDSRMGALGLYEKIGMRVRRSYTRYSKPLT